MHQEPVLIDQPRLRQRLAEADQQSVTRLPQEYRRWGRRATQPAAWAYEPALGELIAGGFPSQSGHCQDLWLSAVLSGYRVH